MGNNAGIPIGEHVLLVFRRHKLFFSLSVGMQIFVMILLIVGLFFVPQNIMGFTLARPIAALVVGVVILLLMIAIMVQWLVWKLTMGVVTDEHLLDIDQLGLFGHNVTAVPLDKVQDVSVNVAGMVQHMLGIGSILVQSAGDQEDVHFDDVENPNEISKKILEIQDRLTKLPNESEEDETPLPPPESGPSDPGINPIEAMSLE